jgi:hypothetical protein
MYNKHCEEIDESEHHRDDSGMDESKLDKLENELGE